MTAKLPDDAETMAPDERLREVAEILAAGLLRLRTKRSTSNVSVLAKTSLDFGGVESVCRAARRRSRAHR